jgi:hypothetical protein
VQKENKSNKEILRELVAIRENISRFTINKIDIMIADEAMRLIYFYRQETK